MNSEKLYRRYQELQQYVGWTYEDARRVQSVAGLLQPYLPGLIDDFYAEIDRHPDARKIITGGEEQIRRLKGSLMRWVRELLSGPYDEGYVVRRWKVGLRHVEIGLDQVYTNVALSRLKNGLMQALAACWRQDQSELLAVCRSLNLLIDLDLAKIEDAYQMEHGSRLQRSERLAAEARVALAKARSEAAFRTLVEAAPCMIVILRPSGAILYFSPFAEKLTGYQAAEVLGKDYLSIFMPEEVTRQAVVAEIQRVLAGTPTRGFQNSVRCKDDSRRWLVWNAERLRVDEGEPAVLTVGQDITTLKQAQEQALQAERLATLGQMVTGLAHESRNALQLIQASLEMLAQEVEDRPEALELVSAIQGAQDRLYHLFEDIRGYAAPINLERDQYNVAKVWRAAWEQLAPLCNGRQIQFLEDTRELELVCPLDLFSLERVFRNIFENSLAACRDPVEIAVRCREVDLQGQRALQIAVRDNGPGLNPEQRQRIFDPFFTTKSQGTGLGMAIAKRIVEAHGGSIAIGDKDGPGAEILISLPRDARPGS